MGHYASEMRSSHEEDANFWRKVAGQNAQNAEELRKEIGRLRNALEHIAGSCDGRAADVARAVLEPPNACLSGQRPTPPEQAK